jgi:hypothetical protein
MVQADYNGFLESYFFTSASTGWAVSHQQLKLRLASLDWTAGDISRWEYKRYATHSKPDQGDGVTWSDHAWDKVYCSSMTKRNGMCFSKQ